MAYDIILGQRSTNYARGKKISSISGESKGSSFFRDNWGWFVALGGICLGSKVFAKQWPWEALKDEKTGRYWNY